MGAGRGIGIASFGDTSNKGRDRNGAPQRSLRSDELGAVIFGCTNATFDDCIRNRIFGLPRAHIRYVKLIKVSLPLFLFNYTQRRLYGIFEAASDGALNIIRNAWSGSGTHFPAQVSMRIREPIISLPENVFKAAIIDNYYMSERFYFELDHKQTGELFFLYMGMMDPTFAQLNAVTSDFQTIAKDPMVEDQNLREGGLPQGVTDLKTVATEKVESPSRHTSVWDKRSDEYLTLCSCRRLDEYQYSDESSDKSSETDL